MKTIGLVMIVKNESRSIRKCLTRAKKLVDKIYITDTGSSDDTVKIAEEFGAYISMYEWNNDFAAARNYALEQSDCDWNLILDADEYLLSGKKKDLQSFMEKGMRIGAIRRYDSYQEDTGEISQSCAYPARFVPKGIRYKGRIHEQIISDFPIVPLPLIFEHDGYLQGGKGERNLEILLEVLETDPKDSYVLYQISRTLWLMKAYERAEEYFEKFYEKVPDSGTGYRAAGVISYIYNLLELEKYEEGFQIIANEKEKLKDYADYHFACGTFYTKAIFSNVEKYVGFLPRIEESYRRCLEIGEVPEHEGVRGNGSFKAAYNLGVWFEVNGKTQEALRYYKWSKDKGYAPAGERIKKLK